MTISLLTGNNGILSQAKVSKEKDKIGKIEEEVKLLYEDAIIKEKLDKNINKVIVLEENLKKEDENARVITANNGTTHLYGGKIGTIQYNNVIIEGGTVEYIYQPKTADIKGGTLTGRNNVALRLWQGTANISGGIFEANAFDGAGTWNVTGGKFKLKPSTARISEGYKCVGPDENGYYEVVKE